MAKQRASFAAPVPAGALKALFRPQVWLQATEGLGRVFALSPSSWGGGRQPSYPSIPEERDMQDDPTTDLSGYMSIGAVRQRRLLAEMSAIERRLEAASA